MKRFAPIAGLLVAAVLIGAPQDASAATKAEELQAKAAETKTEMQELRSELESLKTTCDTQSVDYCVDAMLVQMYELDSNLTVAQQKVYTTLLMAGTQEKRVIRLSIHTIQSHLREHIEELEAIKASSASDEEKKAEIDTLVAELRSYLESKQGQPQDRIEQFLKLKVKAAKVYLSWSIPMAQTSADNYETMGYNTKKVEAQIALADDLYDDALVLYKDGKGDDNDDSDNIQELRRAGAKFIKSRRTLTKAERRLKTMEAQWTAEHNAPEQPEETN